MASGPRAVIAACAANGVIGFAKPIGCFFTEVEPDAPNGSDPAAIGAKP
jgi:hypothetical protein